MEKICKNNKQLILDEEFWIKIKKLIKIILQPISIHIKKLEADQSVIREVPLMFDTLKQYLEEELNENHLYIFTYQEMQETLKNVEERKQMALTSVHYAANILDPRFKGANLNSEEFSAGSDLIHRLGTKFDIENNKVLLDLLEYNGNNGLWGKRLCQRICKINYSYEMVERGLPN